MSAKPASVPTWATDANYPAGAATYSATPTKVAPIATRRQRGWEPKKKPPAQVENYERNLIGQWCQYLNDGAFSGNHSVDGDFEVTGDTNLNGALEVGGTLTVADDAELEADLTVDGNYYQTSNITIRQGYDNYRTDGTGSGVSEGTDATTQPKWLVGVNVVFMFPIRAPLIPGISKIKSFTITTDTAGAPTADLVQITSPTITTELLTGLGITRDAGTTVGSQTTWVFTINGGGVVLSAGARAMIRVHNTGSEILHYCPTVTYSNPHP